MRVMFLTQGATIPSARFRALQFVPALTRSGIACTVRPGYGARYNALARTPWGAPYKLGCRLRQLGLALADAPSFDAIFLQKPIVPTNPAADALVYRRNPRTVFDVDDAIWLGPDGAASPGRARTFERNVERCAALVCGNRFLAAAAARPDKTTVIPTVVDTEALRPAPRREVGPVRIGWIGTAGNFAHLQVALPALLEVLSADVRLRIVSNAEFAPLAGHPSVEQIRWSEAREVELIQSFDIGIMPLVDSEAARGKCAFKMLQYMATAAPVVASPVGANVEVFEGSDAGFLAADPVAWTGALSALIASRSLRAERGEAGRRHVEARYSITSALPALIGVLESVARRPTSR